MLIFDNFDIINLPGSDNTHVPVVILVRSRGDLSGFCKKICQYTG